MDFKTVTRSAGFTKPLRWKEKALVFVNSWSDFFIQEADLWRDEAWEVIKNTPHLTYQILTKRPQSIKDRLPFDWGDGYENVWLGVSVENYYYIPRIQELCEVPAVLRFVSYEPALGPLNIWYELSNGMVDWVISGGESGPKARSPKLEWFIDLQEKCEQCGVPYYHKQNGGVHKVNGIWGGNELNGQTYEAIPGREYKQEQLELC